MDKTITKKYVKIAEDLMYSDEAIKKIRSAKSEYEISQILKNARHQYWDQEEEKQLKGELNERH